MYDDNLLSLSPEEMVSACRREGIMWLVIVKPGPDRRAHDPEKTVKVKSVLRGFEEEGILARRTPPRAATDFILFRSTSLGAFNLAHQGDARA